MKKWQTVLKWMIISLTVFFFIMAVTVMIVGITAYNKKEPLKMFGYTFSIVPTDSMEPDIHVGDFVIGKTVKYDTVKLNDDVIFYSETHKIFIVHRVFAESELGFITKGINNKTVDEGYLTESNFVSSVVWHGNFLGMGNLVSSNRGLIFLVVGFIFLVIILKESFNIYKLLEERKRANNSEETEIDKETLRAQVLQEMIDSGQIDSNPNFSKKTSKNDEN